MFDAFKAFHKKQTMKKTSEATSKSVLHCLKEELASHLRTSHQLSYAKGLSTGSPALDQALCWQGLPQGELSLLSGLRGSGATSIWSQTALQVTKNKKWVAWVNTTELNLCPWPLQRKGCDFSKMLCVSSPSFTRKKLFWALEEMISASLFNIIGCQIDKNFFKESQLLILKQLARRFHMALVFIDLSSQLPTSSAYSLVLRFQKQNVLIERALHRHTPQTIPRRQLYAHPLPQLANFRKALCG